MKLPFIDAGEIVTTHGVHGELKILPWTDGPEFLLDFKRVRIEQNEYELDQCRVQKNCNLVRLKGINSIEQAQLLCGKTVEIYREDVKEGIIFANELKKMDVYADHHKIGIITDVLDYPGNSVYVVKGEREYMIPAVKAFVLNTDLDQNRMDVKLLEGMATDEN